ncbi:MAG: DUF4249 domain-containing protein [Dysgonamonadaceae bacterium]|jgi:hypothetical protein|nr:DUF4249 domain-containing protein [Dysgonamonadaceae bacterium]
MKYKYFLFAAVAAFLFACEKEIEFKGDEVKTKLVLNGILMPDSVVKIQLTESRFFLDSNRLFNQIDDADVRLWKDGVLKETLQNTGEGYYVGTYVPREGDNLRITASHTGFDPVECETQIVSPTPIISADTTNTDIEKYCYYQYDEDDWTIIIDSVKFVIFKGDITITFKDPADIAGYYIILLDLRTRYESGNVYVQPLRYTSDDLVFKTDNELPFDDDDDFNSQYSYQFSDELFDGKEYKIKIKADSYSGYYWPDEDSKITNRELQVTLQSLSPSYYMYIKTREANSDSYFFTEPVQIYTNITGGIGIFGNYSNSTFRIPLD